METCFLAPQKPIVTNSNEEKCLKTVQIDSKRIHFYLVKKYVYLKIFTNRVIYILDLHEIFLNGSIISGLIMQKHRCRACKICKNKQYSVDLKGVYTSMQFKSECIRIICKSNKKIILELKPEQMIFLLKHTHHLFTNHFLKNSKAFHFENNRKVLNQIIQCTVELLKQTQNIGK